MEQSNNFNNPGGGKGPKMPRFNMNWLYTIILIASSLCFSVAVVMPWAEAQPRKPPIPNSNNM